MNMKRKQKTLLRLTAALLCLCMSASIIGGFASLGTVALAEDAADNTTAVYSSAPTEDIVEYTRVADPDTMDTYLDRLLTDENGSRYAGRVWTDKTVFAFQDGNANNSESTTPYDVTRHFDGDHTITLDMLTDGFDSTEHGTVKFNSDFAHVFSVLASSQVINEYPPSPIDLVIVFDMSGSMGQDTRFGIDTGLNTYMAHDTNKDVDENGEALTGVEAWPEQGVLMKDRIANSRVQATLNAINETIDMLMAHNPQNRVAVCGYGANAVVLMPLGHYKRVDADHDGDLDDYLTVGGMETLYHPSDLVYRTVGDDVKKNGVKLPSVSEEGWYWMNNRDTCYTVEVSAEYNTYTGVLNANGDGEGLPDVKEPTTDIWTPVKKTVSNNVLSDDGEPVKAFPGAWDDDGKTPKADYAALSKEVYEGSSSSDPNIAKMWVGGANGYMNSNRGENGLKGKMQPTSGLKADDYVGYFTNTQGGIYLAYKQLADSAATTYSERLSNNVMSTVARIPAAIIMSDGGANFAFNEMGGGSSNYTAEDWYVRYGQKKNTTDPPDSETFFQNFYMNDNDWTSVSSTYTNDRAEGRYLDYAHRLGEKPDAKDNKDGNPGDEWYNVYLPGVDTLGDGWEGLHGIYNIGADYYHDGTLTTPPAWNHAGVLFNSDNNLFCTPGATLEVLLTAAYMNDVVKEHYQNGWNANNATKESQIPLSTFTMNVDTEHVPLWGKMRLYPTLNPKDYPLDKIDDWYQTVCPADKLTEAIYRQYSDYAADTVNKSATNENLFITGGSTFHSLKKDWTDWSNGETASAAVDYILGSQQVSVLIKPISAAAEGNADYKTKAYDKNGNEIEEIIKVDDEKVKANLAYNNEFYDVTSQQLSGIFDEILSIILGKVFVPVSGDNDAGVGDSITYQDPIGEYMEIKNAAITATPFHTENDDEVPKGAQTYDMAVLLFGEMHGLTRTAVYDYQWNDTYMTNKKEHNQDFEEGWYRGDPVKGESNDGHVKFLTGEQMYEEYQKDNSTYDPWADGWVYRVSFTTLVQFVPIVELNNPEKLPQDKLTPENLTNQAKNTVYTLYRFNCTPNDRNKLRRNPVFGTVPTELQQKWKAEADANGGTYPEDITKVVDKDTYPGIYRLSDIRVWVEDTGDFVDTDGAITVERGYSRSLYLNVPAEAVPTELAEITMGPDGVLAYETNLGSDHPEGTTVGEGEAAVTTTFEDYCRQSTPLRLFYAVGVEDDLILRDTTNKNNQIGVNIPAISEEYLADHTDSNNNIWFISNYYSNTPYSGYVTDTTEQNRTRGDPVVTFSPSKDNRYYVYQRPLPLYAHAYRVQSDGTLKPVDGKPVDGKPVDGKPVDDSTISGAWPNDKLNVGGNDKTTWEKTKDAEGEEVQQQPGTWVGGEYMGAYRDADTFKSLFTATDRGDTIKDKDGIVYPVVDGGIVFLEQDLLDHVESDSDGSYTKDSVAFNSDDWFFMVVEYYLPIKKTADGKANVGKDINNKDIPGSFGGRRVQRIVARRGSEFGSAYHSDYIDNGDMLCWYDMNSGLETEYFSRSVTGDNTRGEPDWSKLTLEESALRTYLEDLGVTDSKLVPKDPENPAGEKEGALTHEVNFWTEFRETNKDQIDDLIKKVEEEAKKPEYTGTDDEKKAAAFKAVCKWAVSARTGGLRVGDMANNIQTKGGTYNDGYFENNVTQTANNYYIPTVSPTSGTGDNVKLDSYLGNNGRLAVGNSPLLVTKLVEEPEGDTATGGEKPKEQEFLYQLYVEGLTGEWDATLVAYNAFSKTWQRKIAYIDVLTDNSSLAQTNGNERALFVLKEVDEGSAKAYTAEQVVTVEEPTSNVSTEMTTNYYYADEKGEADKTRGKIEFTGEGAERTPKLYYLYLPFNGAAEGDTAHTRRLYQAPAYDDANYPRPEEPSEDTGPFANNRLTIYYGEDYKGPLEEDKINHINYDSAKDTAGRNAGDFAYWAADAVLIPVSEVTAAEEPENGVWTFDKDYETSGKPYKPLTYYTLVVSRPVGVTSENDVSSPLKTRTMYLTLSMTSGKKLKFGIDASKLYDSIIPTGDRPDLFSMEKKNTTAEEIAKNTAEFTLKHGEGLLLMGLGNRITYRVTEKLTDDQIKAGYTLREVTHVQQRGSASVYRPGLQEIPIYSYEGATYGAAYGAYAGNKTENGLTWAGNKSATMRKEPFAHTNAIMWEYYATMAKDASGNHHQPVGVTDETEKMQIWQEGSPNTYTATGVDHVVSDNPNCNVANSLTELAAGKCDIQNGDSLLHYMYYNGELVDPHYNGESSTFLRNMSRYLVSPTVHFEMVGEKDTNYATSAFPANQAQFDGKYTGVYSTFGNTGYFEEQAQYVNTIVQHTLSITKKLEAVKDETEITDEDMKKDFTFTLELRDDNKKLLTGSYPYKITYLDTTGKEVVVQHGVLYSDTADTEKDKVSTGKKEDIKTTNAEGKVYWEFTLKDGWTMTVSGLPDDVSYEYTITENPTTGFVATPSAVVTGEVIAGGTSESTAKYETFTNKKVPEPKKTETQINGTGVTTEDIETVPPTVPADQKGDKVGIGDEITYEILWANDQSAKSTVTIVDPLDEGVEFVSAEFDGVELKAENVSKGPATNNKDITISYGDYKEGDKTIPRTVTWTLAEREPGEVGHVKLTVRVTEKAFMRWQYQKDSDDPDKTGNPDYEVVDRASVQVGNKSKVYTNTIHNEVESGKLTVTKKVTGTNPDTTKEFSFTVTLTPPEGRSLDPASFTLTITGEDPRKIEFSKQEGGVWKATLTLKDGQTATITNLPAGTNYTVTEADANVEGYKLEAEVVGNEGEITTGGTADVTVTNTYTQKLGSLTITKTVVGGGDGATGKAYTFDITGPDYSNTVTITGNGSETITGLVPGDYTVTERDANIPGYTLQVTGEGTATVTADKVTEVPVTNTYTPIPGVLMIRKQVTDNGKDVDAKSDGTAFDFTLSLTPAGQTALVYGEPDGIYGEGVEVTRIGETNELKFSLRSGDSVSFHNIPVGTAYTVKEEAKAGYSTSVAGGTVGEDGSIREFTAEIAQSDAGILFVNAKVPEPKKTETEVRGSAEDLPITQGVGPEVRVGDEIAYEITWANDTANKATVTVEDKLDKGVDFVRADNGGVYDAGKRTVIWTLADRDAGAYGKVTLIVKVNDSAVMHWDYGAGYDGTPVENGGEDYEVVDRARVSVALPGNKSKSTVTPKIENPLRPGSLTVQKTVAGAGADTKKPFDFAVTLKPKEGVTLTYGVDNGIAWGPQDVAVERNGDTLTFRLAHGQSVTFSGIPVGTEYTVTEKPADGYSASVGIAGGTVEENGRTAHGEIPAGDVLIPYENTRLPGPQKTETDPGDRKMVAVGQEITYRITWINDKSAEAEVTVADRLDPGVDFVSADNNGTYDAASHTVTWSLGKQASGAKDEVRLTVKVNEKSFDKWTYNDPPTDGTSGAGKDHEVWNQAGVQVGNDWTYTNKVENPVPEKEEVTPGAGEDVKAGDEITYRIHWKNGYDVPATVTVKDPLDKGVDFVSADNGGKYDPAAHAVTWTLANCGAGAEGFVTLTVKVNAQAVVKEEVENQASVRVGNDDEVWTQRIPNPLGPGKTETHVNDRDVSGELTKSGKDVTGPAVKLNDTITYKITWVNDAYDAETGELVAATVKVTDPLDKGVDFVSADNNGQYDAASHTVTWNLGEQKAGASGSVTLTVRVNANAVTHWAYALETADNPDAPVTDDTMDYEVVDRAYVEVGNGPKVYTDTIHNPLEPGSLTVTKIVRKDGIDVKDDETQFTFTVELTAPGDVSLNYTGEKAVGWTASAGVDVDRSGDTLTFKLRHGESVTVTNLPEGTAYKVTEAPAVGYAANPASLEGTIASAAEAKAAFVNALLPENEKTETHVNDRDVSGELTRDGTDVTGPAVKVGDTITYRITWVNDRGETANVTVADPLDNGADYVSSEPQGKYDAASHTVTWSLGEQAAGANGFMTLTVRVNEKAFRSWRYGEADEPIVDDSALDFEVVDRAKVSLRLGNGSEHHAYTDTIHNPLTPGGLTVRKAVAGNGGETDVAFSFRVELSDKTLSGAFGGMTFEDGVAEFTLKHGQSVTASGLPAGVGYEVTETEANLNGYETAATGAKGAIPEGETALADFVNRRVLPEVPHTGDDGKPGLWAALACVSAVCILLLRRRKQGES